MLFFKIPRNCFLIFYGNVVPWSEFQNHKHLTKAFARKSAFKKYFFYWVILGFIYEISLYFFDKTFKNF